MSGAALFSIQLVSYVVDHLCLDLSDRFLSDVEEHNGEITQIPVGPVSIHLQVVCEPDEESLGVVRLSVQTEPLDMESEADPGIFRPYEFSISMVGQFFVAPEQIQNLGRTAFLSLFLNVATSTLFPTIRTLLLQAASTSPYQPPLLPTIELKQFVADFLNSYLKEPDSQ